MGGNFAYIAVLLLGSGADGDPAADGSFERLVEGRPGLLGRFESSDPLIPAPSTPSCLLDTSDTLPLLGRAASIVPPPRTFLTDPLDNPPDADVAPSLPAEPEQFSEDPTGRPIKTQRTAYNQSVPDSPGLSASPSDGSQPGGQNKGTASNVTGAKVTDKPWLPLTLALLLLFASLAGNAYLLWIASGFRSRYRRLVDRTGDLAAE